MPDFFTLTVELGPDDPHEHARTLREIADSLEQGFRSGYGWDTEETDEIPEDYDEE